MANYTDEQSSDGFSAWSDLRQFDQDEDAEWAREEEKHVAKQYGGDFIKVKLTGQGQYGYYCDLCLAEMNSKKSLAAHCSGMKHLKKKDIRLKELSGQNDEEEEDGGPGPLPKKKKQLPSPFENRLSNYRREGGRGRGGEFPPRFGFPGRGRPGFARGAPRPGFDFGHPHYMGPQPMGPPRMRLPGPPGPGHFEGGFPGLVGNPYDRIDRPGMPPFMDSGPNYSASYEPQPVMQPGQVELATSATGLLLQKLGSCSVKNENDADLAMSVVASLIKSLKEFHFRNGEERVSNLLMEAEIKVGTAKALKAGPRE